jgi:uracil-DNA glycosylase
MTEFQQFFKRIPADYQAILAHRLNDPHWINLLESIQHNENLARASQADLIFPSYESYVFKAFEITPLHQVKC